MALEADLQAAITKNLSAEVGDALRRRLEQAGSDAQRRHELEQQKVRWEADEKKHGDLTSRELAVTARESKVNDKERELKHLDEIRDLKIKCADDRLGDLRHITHQVFSSPVFRRTIEGRDQIPTFTPTGPNGMQTGFHGQLDLTKSVTETTKES